MGQRSQYIFQATTTYRDGEQKTLRKAGHFQWSWAEHLVYRGGQCLDFLDTITASGGAGYAGAEDLIHGLTASITVHHQTGCVQGASPDDDHSGDGAEAFDNNNGLFLLNLIVNGSALTGPQAQPVFSYAFVNGYEEGGDYETAVTAKQYLSYYPRPNGEGAREEGTEYERLLGLFTRADENGHLMDQATAQRLMSTPCPSEHTVYCRPNTIANGYLVLEPETTAAV